LRAIRKGDRGAAVEDIQRRLIVLGAELGPTGVDGVFLGATYAAVHAFQGDHRLGEDGEVGPETWAALVDATFTLGDRLLYLRFPYLHGEDVRSLQGALNALGFACGEVDGIFGAFTERAVRDFQANTALAADGVVGPDTVRALEALRHAWSSKSQPLPAELHGGPSRKASVLRDSDIVVTWTGATGAVAERLVNLAHASEPEARVRLLPAASGAPGTLVIELSDGAAGDGRAVGVSEGGEALSRRLGAAVAAATGGPRVVVLVEDPPRDEHAIQSLAVSLLDGLCLGLTASGTPVLP
jgi:peptidoglycan hydrolase-like protein with peptidoglycan-binding domain